MAKIIIVKDNKEQTFESMNGACNALGSTSGKNRQSAIRFILSKGYEIKEGATEQELEDAKNKKTRTSTSFIDRIIKKLAKVDQQEVDRIIDAQQAQMKNLKTEKDIAKMVKLGEDLEAARNPEVTKESFMKYMEEQWTKHHEEQ